MKIFLSWSGKTSHKIALVFRDWLPSVIQSIQPYVSSEDIDKGARWGSDIAKELEDSNFGILFITKDNLNAPWLTFEAGALSKTIDKSLVNPFLFNIKRSEIDGPLLQFQSTICIKEEISKLLKTINKACVTQHLSDKRLDIAFETWYPMLKDKLKIIEDESVTEKNSKKDIEINIDNTAYILEELLNLTRIQHKLIRNPEELLPEKYFRFLLKNNISLISPQMKNNLFEHGSYKELCSLTNKCESFISENAGNKMVSAPKTFELMQAIIRTVKYIDHKWGDKKIADK